MAAEDGIYIDHGQALTFSEEMRQQTRNIASVISELESNLAGIVASWLGPDREVYTTKVQPTWNAEVQSLGTILDKHATTLDEVSDNYQNTVRSNAQGFEEIKF
ncbi:WXG100 family type VII secretion target [Streptomyces hyaluromycini]|uniref:WXG100 family type VII secretion target n=1 Tax=Streptomyces hyaluromycini TaxID=1377993 RepID=A0ABV1X2P6_9ACTN|nr:WXG100 family type VII secretion target [Streptomyces hyaluromycini]